MPLEKEDRYILFVLDRYTRKLQIIEPQETSPEELKKQQHLKNLRDQAVDDDRVNKAIAEMEINEEKKEKEHKKYHNHKDKVVRIVNNIIFQFHKLHYMSL